MVSLSKASSILFAASSISSHVANAHTLPKDFDMEKFAVELKELRRSQKASFEASLTAGGRMPNRGKSSSSKTSSDITTVAPPAASADASRIGNPNPGGPTADTFLDGHEFIPPQEGDSRGPCPIINCMANHGFINRSGQEVVAFDIPILGMTLFDLPDTMFPPVVNMAIFDGQVDVLEDGQVLLDIERLWNRPGEERDVSQVFPNPGLNFNEFNLNITVEDGFAPNNEETFINFRYEVDRDLLKQLTDRSSFGRLTIFDHQQHLRTRILDSLDPNGPLHDIFFVFSEESMAVAANQYLFPVMLLGDMVDDFSSIELDVIEDFWTQFRLPEGFAPRSIRFPDTFDFVAFNQARQDWQDENVLIALNAFEQGKSIVKHGEEEEAEEPPTSSDTKLVKA
mmetsp:Transcript_40486/g.84733  ORF Transcript_40486/g.84733 Transcript_40486/m.84733 type:complete len:397 (-) Transcript_40486:6-1196(-)